MQKNKTHNFKLMLPCNCLHKHKEREVHVRGVGGRVQDLCPAILSSSPDASLKPEGGGGGAQRFAVQELQTWSAFLQSWRVRTSRSATRGSGHRLWYCLVENKIIRR